MTRGAFNRPRCIVQPPSRSMSVMDDVLQHATIALGKGENKLKKLTPAEVWAQRSKRLNLAAPADRYAGE